MRPLEITNKKQQQDIKDLTPVRGQDGKISDTHTHTKKGKISGLQRGTAELETNRNLSRWCLIFFRLAPYRCSILFLTNLTFLQSGITIMTGS